MEPDLGAMQEILEKLSQFSDKLPVPIRLSLAQRSASNFNAGKLSDEDRAIAEEIFRILARDLETQVRHALSENLKSSPYLPPDVASTLARDVAEVADPILEHSVVLTDEELVEIVRSTEALTSHLAIARRSRITLPLSEVLMNTGEREIVVTVAQNRGAALSNDLVMRMAETYPTEAAIVTPMVERFPLPLNLTEKLVCIISEDLRREVIAKSAVSPIALEDAIQSTQEWTRIELLQGATYKEMLEFCEHLHAQGKLTPSLIVRALCHGRIGFVEAAMAIRSNIKPANAKKLLHDSGPLGFRAIYKASTMPPGMVEPLRALFLMALQEIKPGKAPPPDMSRRLLERVLDEGLDREMDGMSYLVALMGRNVSLAAA